MKVLVLFLVFFSGPIFSLEIDEKLTSRVVNTSVSKKTILVNRGIEDGLAVGDHAKFYVSVGVVARGVVIKTSPTRSVWSLYRLVNKEYIREEQVLKLKITPAVKITKDESKMLVSDDTSVSAPSDPRDLGIPLAEGADDLKVGNSARKSELERDFDQSIGVNQSLAGKNREIFGVASYSSYSQTTNADDDAIDDITRTVTNLYFKLGGEWYFKDQSAWYARISLLGHFALSQASAMGYEGSQVRENGSEFGFGVNLHPFSKPSLTHKFIPYLNYTLTFGSTNTTITAGSKDSNDISLDAAIFAHDIGVGCKYYSVDRIGLRAEFSYRLEANQFAADANGTSYTRTDIGPRLLMGISYRL